MNKEWRELATILIVLTLVLGGIGYWVYSIGKNRKNGPDIKAMPMVVPVGNAQCAFLFFANDGKVFFTKELGCTQSEQKK